MIKIFISYAHEDEKYKEELEKHLKPLKRRNVIDSWNDREILPGVEWEEQIKTKFESAEVILFLISPDFISSDYINDVEIKKALDRYNKNEVIIIPIILRPVDFSYLEISKFQALPKDGKPISSWDDPDEAWYNVSVQLRKVFNALSSGSANAKHAEVSHPQNPRNYDHIKSHLKSLVAQSRIDEAIESLLVVVKDISDNNLNKSALLLSSRFRNMRYNELNGLTRAEDLLLNRTQITNSLLSLIDEIK